MRKGKQLAIFAFGALLLANSAAAQDPEAWDRWGKTWGDTLVPFLPKASPWGLTVDPYPLIRTFANETYVYKGADSMVYKYPSYITHQTWWFDDPELSRQLADLEKEKAAATQAFEKASDEFFTAHGAEMKALEKAHLEQMNALASHLADLAKQGKYDEADLVNKKLEKLGPFVYPPLQALTEPYDKRQKDMDDRERQLTNRKRQVSFQIHTNRTPTTTAPKFTRIKPAGTLAGHPFYRQDEGNSKAGVWDASFVDLAVFLGPPGYVNPKIKIGHREFAVKTIVVWAWIESRPDTIQADEATAKKVLEKMDYEGLAKLIEP
jgi:hypothetical protein